jgi:hypothetical protein
MNRYRPRPVSLLLGLAFTAVAAFPVEASRPVRKVIVGCVERGVFTSDNGYVIRIRRAAGEPVDLSRWNGRKLRIDGNLLPGDVFFLKQEPSVLGRCN